MQEMWVQSLGQEDPLEEDMATQSSFFAWKIPQTEKCGGKLQSMGLQRVRHNWAHMDLLWLKETNINGNKLHDRKEVKAEWIVKDTEKKS